MIPHRDHVVHVGSLLSLALLLMHPPLWAETPKSSEEGIRTVHVDPLLFEVGDDDMPLFLDVRSAEEWQLGHIRGALHVPLDALPTRLDEIPRDREVVAYCSCPAEETSLAAARILREAGFEDVGVLVGGFERWKLYDGPIDEEVSFEEMFAVAQAPRGWAKRPSEQHRYDRDGAMASSGNASGRIDGTAAETPGVGALFQAVDAEELAGRSLTLTALLRLRGSEDGVRLWVRADDVSGQPVSFVQSPEALVAIRDWERHDLDFEVPETAHRLQLGVLLAGNGTAWIDDVSLTDSEGGAVPSLINPGFED